jgi:hypothetical protein
MKNMMKPVKPKSIMSKAIAKADKIEKRGATATGGVKLSSQKKAVKAIEKPYKRANKIMEKATSKAFKIEKRGATATGGVKMRAQNKAQKTIEKAEKKTGLGIGRYIK